MADEEALDLAERVFEILAMPLYSHDQKRAACMAFLERIPESFLADYPRESEALAGGAFAYGATWREVAAAVRVSVAEAKRRWPEIAARGAA